MSSFKLEINLDNAAFHDDDGDFDPGHELAKILGDVKDKVRDGYFHANCYDTNGNCVGQWEIRE